MVPSYDWELTEDEDDTYALASSSVPSGTPKIIIFLDVDCFEVQVWTKAKRPDLMNKDVPVAAINPQEIVLDINYAAREDDTHRKLRSLALLRKHCGREATDLVVINADKRYGKVDTFRPQIESDFILDVILHYLHMLIPSSRVFPFVVERRNKNEFYIDATQFVDDNMVRGPVTIPTQHLNKRKQHSNAKYKGHPTLVMETREGKLSGRDLSDRIGYMQSCVSTAFQADELRLLEGSVLAMDVIQYIDRVASYKVSGGVGHNKVSSKLGCARNQPEGVTIVSSSSYSRLAKIIPFQQLPGCRGSTGQRIQQYLSSHSKDNVTVMVDVLRFVHYDLRALVAVFQKLNIPSSTSKAMRLYNLCQFHDSTPVLQRIYNDTFTTSLSFEGLTDRDELFTAGVGNLAKDMVSRIAYFTTRGRQATELIIKAETDNILKGPRWGRSNIIVLPQCHFTEHDLFNAVFRYITANNVSCHNVRQIHLTARKIIDVNTVYSANSYTNGTGVDNLVDERKATMTTHNTLPSEAMILITLLGVTILLTVIIVNLL